MSGLERPLRVLIVDDEALARLRLKTLVSENLDPPAQVVGEAPSAAAALQWLAQQRADVLLLDIAMPGLDGMQLAQRLRHAPRPPAVIFVTAHPEHALAAFEVQAVDYLTKPVRRARLQEALQRVAQRLMREVPASGFGALGGPGGLVALGVPSAAAVPEGAIMVHDRGERLRVPLQDVLYLKAEAKYVTLRSQQRTWLLDEPLADIEARLPSSDFVRIHRNAVVALRAVRALERHRDSLDEVPDFESMGEGTGWAVHIAATDEWLAVSRRQLSTVRQALERA